MSLDIFAPKTPPMFGMDISSSAVKLVELSLHKGSLRLDGFSVEPLPANAIADGKINNQEAVGQAIAAGLGQLKSRTRHVAMGIAPSALVTKRIAVSADLKGEDLETVVRAEAAKFIAFPLSEVNIDFQVLGPLAREAAQQEVLVGSVHTDRVDDMVAVAEAAGLKPYVVDSNMLAVQTAVGLIAPAERYPNENIVYIDLGSQAMSVTVFRDGQVIFNRDQSFGGEQLTNDIMHEFQMDRAAAIAVQHGLAEAPDGYVERVLAEFNSSAAQEIFRAFQLFTTSTHYTDASVLVLGGGAAAVPGLDEAVQERMAVRTVVADPFSQMAIGQNVDQDALWRCAPALLTAVGLALRRFDQVSQLSALLTEAEEADDARPLAGAAAGLEALGVRPRLNLLPYREARARENRRQLGVMGAGMAAMALGIGALVHGGFAGYIAQQTQRNDFIKNENALLDKRIGEINGLKDEIAALMSRRLIIESLQSDRAQTVQMMDQMVKLMPAGLYLKSLKQSGLNVTVIGLAMSSDMVSGFMANIAASPYLENPELVEIRAASVGGKRLNEFTLNYSLKRPKPPEVDKVARLARPAGAARAGAKHAEQGGRQ